MNTFRVECDGRTQYVEAEDEFEAKDKFAQNFLCEDEQEYLMSTRKNGKVSKMKVFLLY